MPELRSRPTGSGLCRAPPPCSRSGDPGAFVLPLSLRSGPQALCRTWLAAEPHITPEPPTVRIVDLASLPAVHLESGNEVPGRAAGFPRSRRLRTLVRIGA
ncbi:unnamed protein product [Rangifer tarandus platyrhynchus]|uniref:Uncharacterized protein n=1 Tax=Rangifer tarandus platyrhynchus TaxID=3082113 RepID=A0ABN8YCV7_RANTA|nr:unnamed protein product [Rangifer tarandus platyrhynchus]